MKEEVIKLEEEILQAEEREYRPCMNEYISKVKNYNQLTTDSVSSDVKMKKLIFNDPDEACQMFIKCMNI